MMTDSKKTASWEAAIVIVTLCLLAAFGSAWVMVGGFVLASILWTRHHSRMGRRAATITLAVAALTGGAVAALVHLTMGH